MNTLTWTKTGDVYYLATPGEELVMLQYRPTKKTTFLISGDEYELKRSGFWNQRYTVSRNDEESLSMTHSFWGSKGKLQFADGTRYASDYKYRNTLTLRFLDGDTEILSYHVEKENGNQKAVLHLGVAMVDAEKLLLLATLAMVMFLDIFNEFIDGGDDANAMLILTAAS